MKIVVENLHTIENWHDQYKKQMQEEIGKKINKSLQGHDELDVCLTRYARMLGAYVKHGVVLPEDYPDEL